jgi:hypothetical protein
MNKIRKWSRILHRDFGYFFIGTTLIYAISGIALNHLHDWNPNYTVSQKIFKTDTSLEKNENLKENVAELVNEIAPQNELKKYYFPQENFIKIFLDGGSSIVVNTKTGEGQLELLQKRLVFYEVNYLHYNPNKWWMWFSDIFAGALILFAITSFFMVKGKHGITGTGGIYTALGFIIPILFLILLFKKII